MGPEPITMIFAMSSRRGIRYEWGPRSPSRRNPMACDQLSEIVEQVAGVVRSRRGFGMVLHAKRRHVQAPDALERAVVQVPMGRLDRAEVAGGRPARVSRPAVRIHGEPVVVARDLDDTGAHVLHGLVHPA